MNTKEETHDRKKQVAKFLILLIYSYRNQHKLFFAKEWPFYKVNKSVLYKKKSNLLSRKYHLKIKSHCEQQWKDFMLERIYT